MIFLKVAIASPVRSLFDYTVPRHLHQRKFTAGQRVTVPFGRRKTTGLVVDIANRSDVPADKLKNIIELLDGDAPAMSSELLSLYTWASAYYHFPIGLALQAGLPKAIREGKPLSLKMLSLWAPSEKGASYTLDQLSKAPRQQQVLGLLQKKHPLSQEEINLQLDGHYSPIIKKLTEKGLIHSIRKATERSETKRETEAPLQLNPEQREVHKKLQTSLGHFQCHLLEGVTGSGKTEVYLHLIADTLKKGQQVLVLIPEIGLTPQTLARFERRFSHPVTTVHSGLAESARFAAWLAARDGSAQIIIGTRSAIFLPLKNPGLIIIDEEHDASFKQQEGFRYSARDLAIYRAKQLDIPVLLGSATPSLESLHNALSGRYAHHQLLKRTANAILPVFRCADLQNEKLEEGFSSSLLSEIHYRLNKQQQVLVFLNRRGFSPMLMCNDCGWVAECSRCEIGFTLHRHPPALICHHCEKQQPLPNKCSTCGSLELLPMGMGTERVESFLQEHFPDFPVIRVDRDSTRGKQAMEKIVETVNQNKPCILVGTQMLAKGHHFPKVTLVAILDIDRGLFSTGFRGQEQLGQMVTQVAGRAGRGKEKGEVFIQTHHVSHPLLRTLIDEGYGTLARQLLSERHSTNLPPFSYQALIHAEANQRNWPTMLLEDAARNLNGYQFPELTTLGPLPSPLEKRAGKFRFQLILQSTSRQHLHRGLSALIPFLEKHPHIRKVRWSIDVDPLDFC